MLFAIHCLDAPGALQTRMDNYDAHRAYLNAAPIPLVLAGPINDEAGNPTGSLFVVDAKDIGAARAFNEGDPFYALGVWDRSKIHIHEHVKRRGWLDGY